MKKEKNSDKENDLFFGANNINGLMHSFHSAGRGFGIKYWILTLVSKERMTGAQMMDKISEMSFGFWRPSPGSIYTILKYLTEDGLVKIDEKDNRKFYSITDKGKEYLDSSWFPWRSISRFTNRSEGSAISETVETMDNLSEFLYEKGKILTEDDKKKLKNVDERLKKLLK